MNNNKKQQDKSTEQISIVNHMNQKYVCCHGLQYQSKSMLIGAAINKIPRVVVASSPMFRISTPFT
ncbi:hypothetical protein TUM4438_39630 [Shewanella sairae]|uniref:Uncharacterized protein n=1 Tax=Shewanella sairae TaxID=190310 RepID=A0ABQ4PQ30_9GAMM|nr:hypothetical protein TUM4438_39630 [Shewanella sairae]